MHERRIYEHPMLVFIECMSAKLKEIYKDLKKHKWIQDIQIISGGGYNLVVRIHPKTVGEMENYIGYIEKNKYVNAVCEYPQYKYVTNGIKRGQYVNGAYLFLKGRGNLQSLWKMFSHQRHLVEMYEVPGSWDFIMYLEGRTQEDILKQWWMMHKSGMFKEINMNWTVPQGIWM